MGTLIGIIVIIAIFVISNASLNSKVDNYPISRVDNSKMIADEEWRVL